MTAPITVAIMRTKNIQANMILRLYFMLFLLTQVKSSLYFQVNFAGFTNLIQIIFDHFLFGSLRRILSGCKVFSTPVTGPHSVVLYRLHLELKQRNSSGFDEHQISSGNIAGEKPCKPYCQSIRESKIYREHIDENTVVAEFLGCTGSQDFIH